MASAQGLRDVIAQADHQLHLVPWMPRDNSWRALTDGDTSTATFQTGQFGNPETGLPYGIALTAAAGRFGSNDQVHIASAAIPFRGRACGVLVWRRGSQASQLPLDFKIDRRLYHVEDIRPRWEQGMLINGPGDGSGLVMLDTDIPDRADGRPHLLEIILAGDPSSSGASRTVFIAGLMVDKVSGGYADAPRVPYPLRTPAAVPTSSTTITMTPASGDAAASPRRIDAIVYTNTTSNPIALTVLDNTTQLWTPETPDGMVPPNGSAIFRPGNGMSVTTTLKHVAGASGLNYTVIGGF